MLERFYHYRVTCRCVRDGNPADGCPRVVEYETTEKKSLPEGWVRDERDGYNCTYVDHYSGPCWDAHCDYMIAGGCSEYVARKQNRS